MVVGGRDRIGYVSSFASFCVLPNPKPPKLVKRDLERS